MEKKGQCVYEVGTQHCKKSACFLEMKQQFAPTNEIPLIKIFHFTDQKMLCTLQNSKKELVHFTPFLVFILITCKL